MAIEELYGMTETGTSTINPTAAGNRIGSIGQLAPGFQASIRDDEGVEVSSGTPGRLWIRSRGNTIGYWNRPDATAETIVDGWLDTGDLVAADEQNYFWFRGRKKQIIIHDGSNICPQEVEDSLLENTAVARRRSRWCPRFDSRRDCAGVRRVSAWGRTSVNCRAPPILAGPSRLQGARRNHCARGDANQRGWKSRPRGPDADGRSSGQSSPSMK